MRYSRSIRHIHWTRLFASLNEWKRRYPECSRYAAYMDLHQKWMYNRRLHVLAICRGNEFIQQHRVLSPPQRITRSSFSSCSRLCGRTGRSLQKIRVGWLTLPDRYPKLQSQTYSLQAHYLRHYTVSRIKLWAEQRLPYAVIFGPDLWDEIVRHKPPV